MKKNELGEREKTSQWITKYLKPKEVKDFYVD